MPSQETPPAASPPSSHQVGPFDITRDANALTLRLENHGEVTLQLCLLFAFTMLFVLGLGVLAVLQFATPPPLPPHTHTYVGIDNPARFLSPEQNYFGFCWVLVLVALVFGIPVYVARVYRAALVFTFCRSDDAVLRNNRLITRLRKVEYVRLREIRDPDDRYLYHLDLVYGDGREMPVHSAYEERQVMNLANEIAAFVGTKVVWK